MENTLILSQLR